MGINVQISTMLEKQWKEAMQNAAEDWNLKVIFYLPHLLLKQAECVIFWTKYI